jgi:hypothetical protein
MSFRPPLHRIGRHANQGKHPFRPKGGPKRIPAFTGMTATCALYPTKARSIT